MANPVAGEHDGIPKPIQVDWFRRVHLALTLLLVVGLFNLVILTLMGRVRFGRSEPSTPQTAAPSSTPEQPDAPPKQEAATQVAAKTPADEGGRYRIELMDDAHRLMEISAPSGFYGLPMAATWVYKYSGGYLECQVETESEGKTTRSDIMPPGWRDILGREQPTLSRAETLGREGYIVLAAMPTDFPAESPVVPYLTPLGEMLTTGQAGVLHRLTALHLRPTHQRSFRLFLSSSPPKGLKGHPFTMVEQHNLPLTSALVPNPEGRFDKRQIGVGKDLSAGLWMRILEWERPEGTVRLKARFLTDVEAVQHASGSR